MKHASKPKLLAGGNPQTPKGDGDAPVQTYIAAMPGWKSRVGRKLDTTEGTRYFHDYQHDELDEKQLAAWVKQASKLPGEALQGGDP